MKHTHVRLLSDQENEDGRPAFEEIAAESLGNERYRLLDSPIAVLGCAREDIIELSPKGTFELIEQGGRMSIQVFTNDDPILVRNAVTSETRQFGGTIDNISRIGNVFVISIPLDIGSLAVVRVMNGITKRFVHTDWQYGNAFPQSGGDHYLSWTKEFFSH